MTNKPSAESGGSGCLVKDDPPQEQWQLECDNDRAARLANYAGPAYLD